MARRPTAAGRAAARNPCSARATWASGQGWGRAAWGGLVEPGVEPRAPVVGESDGPSPVGRAADRVVDELRPARAAATCKAEGLERTARVAPVVPVQPARKSCRPVLLITAMR